MNSNMDKVPTIDVDERLSTLKDHHLDSESKHHAKKQQFYAQDLEEEKYKKLQRELLEDDLNSKKTERFARMCCGVGVFIFVAGYIIGVSVVLAFSKKWQISDNVLMVLLGTTAINVVGLLNSVVKYLFPK